MANKTGAQGRRKIIRLGATLFQRKIREVVISMLDKCYEVHTGISFKWHMPSTSQDIYRYATST